MPIRKTKLQKEWEIFFRWLTTCIDLITPLASIHWDPHALPNPHLVLISASGSGKTQTLKAMAHELANYGQT